MKQFRKFWVVASWQLKAGLILTTVMTLLAILGQIWTPYSPTSMNGAAVFQTPSFSHLMGCDNFGRDIFSRVINGIGITFLVAIATVLIGFVIGTIVGLLTGYFGGVVDEVLMRFNDIILSFPSVLLALIFISILGYGTYQIVLALGLLFIPSFARIVRSEVLRMKELDYVRSARVLNIPLLRLLFVHILPCARVSLISAAAIGFNNAVLAEASMSYLGLGVQPPTPSLGRMLSESQGYLMISPWYALFPGLVIILIILGFALLSDGLKQYQEEGGIH